MQQFLSFFTPYSLFPCYSGVTPRKLNINIGSYIPLQPLSIPKSTKALPLRHGASLLQCTQLRDYTIHMEIFLSTLDTNKPRITARHANQPPSPHSSSLRRRIIRPAALPIHLLPPCVHYANPHPIQDFVVGPPSVPALSVVCSAPQWPCVTGCVYPLGTAFGGSMDMQCPRFQDIYPRLLWAAFVW